MLQLFPISEGMQLSTTSPQPQRLAARSVAELWTDYVQRRTEGARNALVVHYLPLVRRVADRMVGGLPASVDAQDLYAEGHLGLIEAIERFDPDRGAGFETFAQWRIRGAIRDYLRRLDWLSRSTRDRLKEVEAAIAVLQQRLSRTPTDEEIAEHLGASGAAWSAAQVREALSHCTTSHVGSLDDLLPASAARAGAEVPDAGESPAERTAEVLQLHEARRAIAQLADRERQLVALYFYEELTLADIGRIFGVTESRVSQMLKKLLIALAARLETVGA